MTHWKRVLIVALVALVALATAGLSVSAQEDTTAPTEATEPADGQRPGNIELFGGADYTGGHLKYTYKVSREGVDGYSITTTEITPQDDGMYLVESSSSDLVEQSGVSIAFFGIALGGLGFRIPSNLGGAIDLSPLEYIEDEDLEENNEYVLPDGGYLVTEDLETIAGVEVIHATYTHADYTNVSIDLAMPTDLEIRNLLPIFPLLKLNYSVGTDDAAASDTADDSSDDGEGAPWAFHMYSSVELTDFVYEPLEE